MTTLRRPLALFLLMTMTTLIAACGGADAETGIRVVSPDDAFETLFEAPPEGLVVLDVRTPDEFNGQRIADSTLIDFYEPDFQAQLAELDRDAPYLMYCRSGNRSGQTRALMEDMGFTNVQDIEGGIVNWVDQGHPTVAG